MCILRQSTARTILIGPILDSEGAAKTDEVVGNIKITKNGTVGAANGSATLTHDHAGKYKLAMTASDTDTVGVLEISLSSGTNDMQVARVNVVEEAVWDALVSDTSPTVSGVASTFTGMVAQLWRRFFRKATKTSTQIKTYADDGATVVTTQTISDSSGTETQGAAS